MTSADDQRFEMKQLIKLHFFIYFPFIIPGISKKLFVINSTFLNSSTDIIFKKRKTICSIWGGHIGVSDDAGSPRSLAAFCFWFKLSSKSLRACNGNVVNGNVISNSHPLSLTIFKIFSWHAEWLFFQWSIKWVSDLHRRRHTGHSITTILWYCL